VQTEKLGDYVEMFTSIDYQGVPIMVVVFGKEFISENVIKLEKLRIPVYGTPEQAIEVIAVMYYYKKRIAHP